MMQRYILELVYILKKSAPTVKLGGTFKNNNGKTIEEIIEYVNANLTSDINLESLSQRARFSQTYFHNLFKKSTGQTLHEYIEDRRIKKSVNLMLSTNMTLTEIAYECGFSSQSYFSYAFKRKMKATPREYVKGIYERYEK